MGDRANIISKTRDQQVCFYTHWDGYLLPHILKEALERGKDRWDDYQYLNRIIFCKMIGGNVDGMTGYGISSTIADNDRPILTVNVDSGIVNFSDKDYTFQEYIDKEWATFYDEEE